MREVAELRKASESGKKAFLPPFLTLIKKGVGEERSARRNILNPSPGEHIGSPLQFGMFPYSSIPNTSLMASFMDTPRSFAYLST